MCNDFCVAFYSDRICSVSSCNFHIILYGNNEELLKKMACIIYTDTWIVCIHFSSVASVENYCKEWTSVWKRATSSWFNHRNKGRDRIPCIAKKRLLWKKFKKHYLNSFQRWKTTQTSPSLFAERLEKFEKAKFELELIKIVDCFSDSHGTYDSNLVNFKMKSS